MTRTAQKHIEAAANLLASLAPANESIAPFFILLGEMGPNPTPAMIDGAVRATVAQWGWPQ
jgi:hypothetical protein